jgi:hypothetical protein
MFISWHPEDVALLEDIRERTALFAEAFCARWTRPKVRGTLDSGSQVRGAAGRRNYWLNHRRRTQSTTSDHLTRRRHNEAR